ncbi:MAG TPA: type II secretion system F family protein [Xanthobacteraceae bacterium]
MALNTLAIFFLAAAAIGGLAWVFVYPILSGERQAERRRQSVAQADSGMRKAVAARAGQRVRREQIEETLKELETRSKKAKSPPLSVRLEQSGLGWSKRQFVIVSAGLAAAFFVLPLTVGADLLTAGLASLAAGFGLPRWLLSFLKKRRERKFIDDFPDSVDIIVRGIKAGLPLLDSLKIIVRDAPEPLRGEFRAIVETQAIGLTLGEACGKLYERIPLPEANFFGIVISIQQKAGGNLSEALGNLSKVLRDRKKMKAKIRAMSMEAKASAGIIGVLPIVVLLIVYVTSPDYISLLWQHPMGRLMIAGSALWMLVGVFTMRKMINFDF